MRRAVDDGLLVELFDELGCDRDRALIAFYLSSGARASELLGLRHVDVDWGAGTITVVTKGSRAREVIQRSTGRVRVAARRRQQADMRQRTRTLAPRLPTLIDTAQRRHHDAMALHDTAQSMPAGAQFDLAGVTYVRIARSSHYRDGDRRPAVRRLHDGLTVQTFQNEDEAFWAWAIVEALRQTGTRCSSSPTYRSADTPSPTARSSSSSRSTEQSPHPSHCCRHLIRAEPKHADTCG